MTFLKNDSGKKNKKRTIIYLVSGGCFILSILAVLSVLLLNKPKSVQRLIDLGGAIKGISINGTDISGMTKEEASQTAKELSEKLLEQNTISIDVNGKVFKYSLKELGIGSDYDSVALNAYDYGHYGTFEERTEAVKKAGTEGVDFAINFTASQSKVADALWPLRLMMDIDPVDAGYKFFPQGYLASGESNDKSDESKAVRLSANEMPNALRYQYWRTNKFVQNYIPKDANISRFQYTEGKDGLSVNLNALASMIVDSVNRDDFSTVTAPFENVEPKINVSDLKHQTQLIASWTSSYASHANSNRVYNISKLSGIINGVVIAPGETWSINKEAGPRTEARGWKNAAGITKGAMLPQPGGGVCQVSSTTYNAAIRANLTIVESTRHSIISNYIPIGLDATISTGYPDLKLKNPYGTPVFIISYVNKTDKNITVEIYGQPVTDSKYGEVILDFSSQVIGHTGTPGTVVHHASRTPSGKAVAPGQTKTYIKARRGTTVQTYIHYLSPDGKELSSNKFYVATYPKTSGEAYVND